MTPSECDTVMNHTNVTTWGRRAGGRSAGTGAGLAGGLVTPGLLVTNGSLIAGIYACAKVAAEHGVSSLGMLSWQLLFAAAVMVLVVAVRREWPRLTGANLRYAGVAGVLGITGPNLVTFAALGHLPAGLIGVLTALSPLFTYTIALALRIERPNALRAAGVVLGLAGVLAIVLPRGALPTPDAMPWALFAMAAPLLLAAGNVYRTLAWPEDLKPMSAAVLLLALQALLLVPLALATGHFELPGPGTRSSDIALLAAGGLTVAFYLGAFELQKRGGPVVVGQMGYVITIASLAIGMLVFGERPAAATFAAVAVVLAGVALVNRRPADGGAR
jgi:drug/metabolite transporter (DMT)-like permease